MSAARLAPILIVLAITFGAALPTPLGCSCFGKHVNKKNVLPDTYFDAIKDDVLNHVFKMPFGYHLTFNQYMILFHEMEKAEFEKRNIEFLFADHHKHAKICNEDTVAEINNQVCQTGYRKHQKEIVADICENRYPYPELRAKLCIAF